MSPTDHQSAHPDFPFLSPSNPALLLSILQRLSLASPSDHLSSLSKAGEGNMNLTLRAQLASGTSLIVKQSRPWVEKYDFIPAPWDRANTEAAFYQQISSVPSLASSMPRFLAADPASRILILQDLGPSSDLSSLYQDPTPLPPSTLTSLATWLRTLHDTFRNQTPPPALVNADMRALNHAYIFDLPLKIAPDKLESLAPGLSAATAELTSDPAYLTAVSAAGHTYLTSSGPCLLHGDFFPGSWLQTPSGIKIIDPEFTHFGPPEFDVAIALAHLALAQQPQSSATTFLSAYGTGLNPQSLATSASIEVMRRLIGLAQLPLSPNLNKPALLRKSHQALKQKNPLTLFS